MFYSYYIDVLCRFLITITDLLAYLSVFTRDKISSSYIMHSDVNNCYCDAYADAVYAVVVCLSVCLLVTLFSTSEHSV